MTAVRACAGRRGCVAFALLLAFVFEVHGAEDPLAVQRESFAKVLKAQAAGRHTLARKLAAGLEDYPLYPYFRYEDLRRRLHRLPEADVAHFLTAYGDSYLGARLRKEWLRQLARRARWESFLRFYAPQDDTKLRCQQVIARIRTGVLDGVLADARELWLVGRSQPDECDPVFERLYASPLMNDDLVWQRIRLAMEAGKSSLARYLSRRLGDPERQARFRLWELAHTDPARALAGPHADDDAETREILVYAVRRLARRQLGRALTGWERVAGQLAFTDSERGRAAAVLAVAAARVDDERRIELLDRVPPDSVNADVERYRLREGILLEAWPELVRWTVHEPVSDLNRLRWRYWRARALAEVGRGEESEVLLHELARERDYYGFVAADRLGEPYDFNFVPVSSTRAERSEVLAVPGVLRARELFLLDRPYQARREWIFELNRFERRHREVAAELAAGWGWHDRAIFALGRAESWDDLHLRFPLLHTEHALEYAERRGLSAARVLAIIRSESAFIADARSPAGALGLMQVMPRTARETAKRIGMRYSGAKMLYDPRRNVAIGTAYLERMLARYSGNFAMAAAAYNAGAHRVRQWQRGTCVDAERWIDTIPFTETRRYVRRAYFYTAVYEWRLEQDVTRLSSVLYPVPPRGSTSTADCTT